MTSTTLTDHNLDHRVSDRLLVLSPGIDILLRADCAVQCGLDTFRAGIFDITELRPGDLIAFLRSLDRPHHISVIHAGLIKLGLKSSTASMILEDLTYHGVLVDPVWPTVCLIGPGSHGFTIASVLKQAGARVIEAEDHRFPELLLDSVDRTTPLIVAGHYQRGSHYAKDIYSFQTIIPIEFLGGSAIIGPLRIDGHGPCPVCGDLYATEKDPHWGFLLDQRHTPGRNDPIVEYSVAARLAALLAPAYPSPGIKNDLLRPGLKIALNPYRGAEDIEVVGPHRSCPYCWEHAGERPRFTGPIIPRDPHQISRLSPGQSQQ
ncbi:hypothetical protein [Corynebacterium sp. ES2715-CONJ3]|uniref:hypothetical protein n=1 Tax=Corynebacterium sp. ES2715-CONJ3 TaxID=2974028 RepID=UPI00216917C4|nr:hypothetical protein [Corynebacterium sp. ES2715-CONJ3]MCS4491531.1 hypothetical protein [Corynebacterium sp. ES2715-CONJ3]